MEFGGEVDGSFRLEAVEPAVAHHRRRLQHVLGEQGDGAGIEQRCCDPPCAMPLGAFRRQQSVAQRRPQAALLLQALAVVGGIADQHVLDFVGIVDQHELAQAADLQDRRLIRLLGESGDGICP